MRLLDSNKHLARIYQRNRKNGSAKSIERILLVMTMTIIINLQCTQSCIRHRATFSSVTRIYQSKSNIPTSRATSSAYNAMALTLLGFKYHRCRPPTHTAAAAATLTGAHLSHFYIAGFDYPISRRNSEIQTIAVGWLHGIVASSSHIYSVLAHTCVRSVCSRALATKQTQFSVLPSSTFVALLWCRWRLTRHQTMLDQNVCDVCFFVLLTSFLSCMFRVHRALWIWRWAKGDG